MGREENQVCPRHGDRELHKYRRARSAGDEPRRSPSLSYRLLARRGPLHSDLFGHANAFEGLEPRTHRSPLKIDVMKVAAAVRAELTKKKDTQTRAKKGKTPPSVASGNCE